MKILKFSTILLCVITLVCACTSKANKEEENTSDEQEQEEIYRLAGTINDKYNVHMILDMKSLNGAYYYDKSGVDNYLTLKIHSYNPASGQMTVDEFNNKGEQTGEFSGTLSDSGFSGNAKFGSKTMPFNLAICNDPSAKFPQIVSESESPSALATSEETIEVEDETSGWKPPFEFQVEREPFAMNNMNYKTVITYQLLANGRLKVKEMQYVSSIYTPDEWEINSTEEKGGKWSTCSISRGEGYQKVYVIDRSDYDHSLYLPDDLEYFWNQGEGYDYFDCENYDLKKAVKVLHPKKL